MPGASRQCTAPAPALRAAPRNHRGARALSAAARRVRSRFINLQGTAAASGNVGKYETLRVAGVVGATVTFAGPKAKSYGSGATDDAGLGTTAASQRVALVRVPNFASITVAAGATLTTDAWNGAKGGVLFLRSAGAVSIAGMLSLDGKGYRGGGRPANVLQSGFQGESYGGLGTGLQPALLGGGGGGLGDACAGYGSAGGGAGYGGLGLNGSSNCTGRGRPSTGTQRSRCCSSAREVAPAATTMSWPTTRRAGLVGRVEASSSSRPPRSR